MISENGRLYKKYGNRSTYILISQNAILSRTTKLFGKWINVVGRTCDIHSSVNATSSPSSDPLFEDFHFKLVGNLTVTETCPSNRTYSSFEWTISANTKLRLPVACSLHSKLINCNSIILRSSESQEVHFYHHRMEIVEQHWEEEKLKINETVFVKRKISMDPLTDATNPLFLDSHPRLKWISHPGNHPGDHPHSGDQAPQGQRQQRSLRHRSELRSGSPGGSRNSFSPRR